MNKAQELLFVASASALIGWSFTMGYASIKHKEYVDNELKARYSTDVTKKQ